MLFRSARANAAPDDSAVKVEDDDDSGLVFDDTSEFVRSVQYDPVAVKVEPKTEPREQTIKVEESEADVRMQDAEESDEAEAGEITMKEEEDEEAMLHALQGAMQNAEANVKKKDEDPEVGTAEELTYGPGLASTLRTLQKQGLIAPPSADQKIGRASCRERVCLYV